MTRHPRRFRWACATCLSIATVSAAAASPQKNNKDAKELERKRPKLTLKALPLISTAPSRVVLTAELIGGSNDFEEYYCPAVEWEWGDGTSSEASADCEPYESGKSEIKRRFVVQHVFRAGNFRVFFRLKRHNKVVTSASTSIQVRQGAGI